jgi:hypothetical protein
VKSVDGAMDRYARGEKAAFDLVYDAVAPRLEAFLRRRVREKALVADVIQQTFLEIIERAALSSQERRSCRGRLPLRPTSSVRGSFSGDAHLEASETERRISKAFAALTPVQREASIW